MEASAVVPALMPQMIPLEVLQPSKTNPAARTKGPEFDDLVTSVRRQGVLVPILVRPDGELYEVVAGHRRVAAARAAGVFEIPAMVREMSESESLELQLIENIQRADLHPLQEAEGYLRLMQLAKLDAAGVSERIGRSVAYVYDRIKLLELIPEAREIFLAGRILAGHAVILARLKPDAQKRTLKEGLFTHQELLFDPLEPPFSNKQDESKAVSAKELQAWVDDHIRFDPQNVDPMLFPDTALALEAAPKFVAITFSYHLRDSAKDPSRRTYGEQAWKRADGLHKSKTCEHSVTGLVVAGARRGEAFLVCVNKDKCAVHWAEHQRARKSRVATAARGSSGGGGATPRQQPKTDEKLEAALRAANEKANEAIEGAVAAVVSRMSAERFLRALLASHAGEWAFRDCAKTRKITIPEQGKAFATWAGKIAISTVNELLAHYEMSCGDADDFADSIGVDIKAIYLDHEQRARAELKGEATPATPKRKSTSKPAKKAASKKRSR